MPFVKKNNVFYRILMKHGQERKLSQFLRTVGRYGIKNGIKMNLILVTTNLRSSAKREKHRTQINLTVIKGEIIMYIMKMTDGMVKHTTTQRKHLQKHGLWPNGYTREKKATYCQRFPINIVIKLLSVLKIKHYIGLFPTRYGFKYCSIYFSTDLVVAHACSNVFIVT